MSTAVTEQRQPSNQTALQASIAEVEEVLQKFSLSQLDEMGTFRKNFAMAHALSELDRLITPNMMQSIMRLQNTSLGFRTDKREGYPVSVVKNVAIEAMLRGFEMIGNEVNIIGGNFYGTRNGYRHLLRDYPGLTDLHMGLSVPRVSGGGAVVEAEATWKLNGRADMLKRSIPVKINAGQGADAILGKADRKMRCSIYEHITGTFLPEGEVGEDDLSGGAIDISEGAEITATVEPDATPELPASRTEATAAKVAQKLARGKYIERINLAYDEAHAFYASETDARMNDICVNKSIEDMDLGELEAAAAAVEGLLKRFKEEDRKETELRSTGAEQAEVDAGFTEV